MNDITKSVIDWLEANIGLTITIVIVVFSLFFEFSKIKLSPITALLNWIGARLTGGLKADISSLRKETNEKIDDLKKDTEEKINELNMQTTEALNDIKKNATFNCEETKRRLEQIEISQDRAAAARIKAHVLSFSRSLRVGEKHTEEDFRNLIKENEEYEKLIKRNKWTNDVYKADYEFFYHEYQRCQKENDFLK